MTLSISPPAKARKLAVIGSGISGMGAAWALGPSHDVTLFETRNRPGGHSATVDIDHGDKQIAVDTGFIVYNNRNYPHLSRLFDHLDVETEESCMSFSVSLDEGRFEWCGYNLRTIFAQKRNLLSPRFLLMLGDILRFNARAKRDLETGALCGLTFGDYMSWRGYSASLRDDYLVPMTAAIWSTPAARMLDFPAESLIRFLDNHRLMQISPPKWRTVSGGSRNYVSRLLKEFRGHTRFGAGVRRIERQEGKVIIEDASGTRETFDGVVMATHSDQALSLLGDPSSAERSVLSAIPYRKNEVWLHRDPTLMPRRRDAWAAWNYLSGRDADGERSVAVTYWMNRLQNIDERYPVFITLNPPRPPREDLTFGFYDYAHPQFDATALDAQQRLPLIQGENHTWYCGAWTRYGFHEDGLASGLQVADMIGTTAPWDGKVADIMRAPVQDVPPALQAAE